ncbi:hypothetical protein DP590_07495 [Salmonella enterica]|nr:hypothetical protein [Salmonella enterica]ECE0741997.1 hypothetical protein [Salmonella enterica subsp. enterica serovar Hvittingfoss]HEC8062470.1 hypothetical protein [Salmonella enterica subsp. enterica serovar Potsdam]EGA8118250.1 hypothetical protein [Salmonella enterica]EHO8673529.1 hypothetical protein [Salmonella enterica]
MDMSRDAFYREVSRRADVLGLSVELMKVVKWLEVPENVEYLRELCRETEVFLDLYAGDSDWRRQKWKGLSEDGSEQLKMVLSLSGGVVLRHNVENGDMYAGAVLHRTLRGWLEMYCRKPGEKVSMLPVCIKSDSVSDNDIRMSII